MTTATVCPPWAWGTACATLVTQRLTAPLMYMAWTNYMILAATAQRQQQASRCISGPRRNSCRWRSLEVAGKHSGGGPRMQSGPGKRQTSYKTPVASAQNTTTTASRGCPRGLRKTAPSFSQLTPKGQCTNGPSIPKIPLHMPYGAPCTTTKRSLTKLSSTPALGTLPFWTAPHRRPLRTPSCIVRNTASNPFCWMMTIAIAFRHWTLATACASPSIRHSTARRTSTVSTPCTTMAATGPYQASAWRSTTAFAALWRWKPLTCHGRRFGGGRLASSGHPATTTTPLQMYLVTRTVRVPSAMPTASRDSPLGPKKGPHKCWPKTLWALYTRGASIPKTRQHVRDGRLSMITKRQRLGLWKTSKRGIPTTSKDIHPLLDKTRSCTVLKAT